MVVWLLVEPQHLELIHFSKKEIQKKIVNLEMEYLQIIGWNTYATPPTDVSSQWGHNIKIVGEPRKIGGSKIKSFMADTFGFVTNGELSGVSNYPKSHEGFELEQVSIFGVL